MPQNFPANGQIFANDIAINDSYPKIQFAGTETNAQYVEQVEVAGSLYIVQNAAYNKWSGQWLLVNATLPAYAMAITNGQLLWLTNPAGNTPFSTWTTSGTVTTTSQQSGTVTAVPADGSSAATVTFAKAYTTSLNEVIVTVRNNFAVNSWALMASTANLATTGFSIYVVGAPSGQTVQVDWIAIGQ